MSKRNWIFLTLTLGCIPAFGQAGKSHLAGRIELAGADSGNLYVELRDPMGHSVVGRSPVGNDGSFTFEAPTGYYDVRVLSAVHDDLITEEYVQVNPMAGPVVLRLPQREKSQPVSGTVSVQELQKRVPKKAWQAFLKAQQYSQASQTDQAIAALRRAIKVYPGWRDAHSNLGVQLLRAGRTDDAVAELREAIRLGPPTALLYTNLGAALATSQHLEEGESAVHLALKLDPADGKAQYLLGHLLAVQPGREKEALENLRKSDAAVPAAKIIEAQVLLRTGDRAGAAAQLRAYLQTPDPGHRKTAEELLRQIGKK